MWQFRWRRLRISRADVTRYAGPRRSSNALEPAYGLLVRLRAKDLDGIGEVAVGPSEAERAWSCLEHDVAQLVGAAVPARLNASDPLRQIERHFPTPLSRASRPHRAARLAVETALIDLMLKAADQTPRGVWGGQLTKDQPIETPLVKLPRSHPDAGTHPALAWFAADGTEADQTVPRLRSTGDPNLDEAWLQHLNDLDAARGRRRPLWLVGRRQAAVESVTELVRSIAKKKAAGSLRAPVLLEEPTGTTGCLETLSALQAVADDLLGAGAGMRELSILAGASITSANKLDELLTTGRPLGGVCLYPARWGTWFGVADAARAIRRADPSMVVAVVAPHEGTDITGAVVRELGSMLPAVDLFGSGKPTDGWPQLLRRRTRVSERSGSPGIGLGLNYPKLAAVADRLAEFPSPGVPGEQPNRYDEQLSPGAPLGLPKQTILEVRALQAGLRVRRYTRKLFLTEAPVSGRVVGFSGCQSSAVPVPAAAIATHKGLTRELLAASGLPVARGAWFPAGEVEEARVAAEKLGFPLVVKPVGGLQGRGVTTGITSPEDLEAALRKISSSRYQASGVVLERMVTGNDYRILATANEVIAVTRRDPASVIGDGVHTIEELVLATNVARRRNPYLGRHLVPLNKPAVELLRSQGKRKTSVLKAGERVRLSAVANLSQGGDSRNVLESTHHSVLELAMAAVAAIPGLPYGGVDIFLEDHTKAVVEQAVTIIEINHNPAALMHHFPMFGPSKDAWGHIFDELIRAEGLPHRPTSDPLTIRLTVYGRVTGVGYRQWAVRVANELKLDGWVSNAEAHDEVRMVLHGSALPVGVMLRLAFRGPANAAPVETVAEVTDSVPEPGFRVLDKL